MGRDFLNHRKHNIERIMFEISSNLRAIYLRRKPINNRIMCRLFTNIVHTVANNH
jgi:hypothetical protein